MRGLSRKVAVTAILAALGNVLALISTSLGNIHPQIAVDLSHLATIIAAYSLGPAWATLVGGLISTTPFVRFGLMGPMGPLAASLIFPGKAMTGLFVGLLAKRLKFPFLAVVAGYVPESIFTWLSFKIWIPMLAPHVAGWMTDAIIFTILTKAWLEILIMAAISQALIPRLARVLPELSTAQAVG